MKKKLTTEQVFDIALKTSEILIESGAEIFRIEDTAKRMCYSRGFKNTTIFVTPTLLIFTTGTKENQKFISRSSTKNSDLNKIALVNDFSRKFVSTNMSYDTALDEIAAIDKAKNFSNFVKILGSSVGSAFFTLLLNGTIHDLLPCFVITFIAMNIIFKIEKLKFPVVTNIVFGFIIAFIGVLFEYLNIIENLDIVLVSAVLPILPGILFTNGALDLMHGDLLSGTARLFEATILIISINFGVGFIVDLWSMIL